MAKLSDRAKERILYLQEQRNLQVECQRQLSVLRDFIRAIHCKEIYDWLTEECVQENEHAKVILEMYERVNRCLD